MGENGREWERERGPRRLQTGGLQRNVGSGCGQELVLGVFRVTAAASVS